MGLFILSAFVLAELRAENPIKINIMAFLSSVGNLRLAKQSRHAFRINSILPVEYLSKRKRKTKQGNEAGGTGGLMRHEGRN